MSTDPLAAYFPRVTPQSEPADPGQVRNSAGGYVFPVTDRTRATRFLILGTEGGTYYVSERDLTRDNAGFIVAMANGAQAGDLLDLVIDVSTQGRAKKQNATMFTLAALCASSNEPVKARALAAIQAVCRTGTMLFVFARYVEQFRGHGKGLNRALLRWYTDKTVDDAAYQAVKYRQREGWSHRDLLRLVKNVGGRVKVPESHRPLFGWITGHPDGDLPRVVAGFEQAQTVTTAREWARLVGEYRLSWEMLPDNALAHAEVWEALVPTMGLGALIRQLPRLTNVGYVAPMSVGAKTVVERLADASEIARSRVHPLAVLVAAVTYARGEGMRGSSTWVTAPQIVDALDGAFYAAYGNIVPAGKRTLVACDVSGSMTMGQVGGTSLAPIQAEMGLAMCLINTEPQVFPMAFSQGFVPLPLSLRTRLDDAVRQANGMPCDGTDCSVPMLWAAANHVEVDTFVTVTDNETWAGRVHPHQALRAYRDQTGIPARSVVVGMTATGFTIADPSDAGQMDLVGFDAGSMDVLSAFSRGDL